MATEPFLGTMVPFGGNFTIAKWGACSGGLLGINQYQALFAILGTTFGGDGRTTLGLPDLKGRSPVGMGTLIGGSTYLLGWKGGAEQVYLTEEKLPRHSHAAAFTQTSGAFSPMATLEVASNGASATVPTTDSYLGANTNSAMYFTPGFEQPELTEIQGLQVAGGVSVTGTVTVGETGADKPGIEILNPVQAVNWLIAIEGAFPSRN